MKKTILSLTTILALGLTGCGGSGSGDADTTAKVSMTIKYADGSTFGVTRAEDQEVNGGYPIYNVGTGEQNGFIQVDGSVNDINGVDLGVCQGALDEKGDFTEECTVPRTNPTVHPEEPDTDNGSNTASGNNNDSHGGTDADSSGAGGDDTTATGDDDGIPNTDDGSGGSDAGDGSGGVDEGANS